MGESVRLGLLLVGFGRSQAVSAPVAAERIHASAFRDIEGRRFDAIVLGDMALASLSPERTAGVLSRGRVEVVLCPDRCDTRCLAQWLQAGFTEVVLVEQLAAHLLSIDPRLIRPRLELEDWIPVGTEVGHEVGKVLQAVPRLHRAFCVGDWARATTLSRQRLWRIVFQATGLPPREVLWRYVEAVVSRARAEGLSLVDAAALLGYSEAAALVHAFSKKGEDVPGRGAAGPPAPRARLSPT